MRAHLAAANPGLAETIDAYLDQIAVSLRSTSVQSATSIPGRFCGFLAERHPDVNGAADIGRRHIEDYKLWLAAREGTKPGSRPTPNTIRANLGTVRMFFERIIEWDWPDAPGRVPIFPAETTPGESSPTCGASRFTRIGSPKRSTGGLRSQASHGSASTICATPMPAICSRPA